MNKPPPSKNWRAKLESKIFIYYAGKNENNVTGYAFFATDIVRTKEAAYMTVVNPDSTIRLIEILAFYEPMDYFPAPRWLELFRGKWLNDKLWLKRDIHNFCWARWHSFSGMDSAEQTTAG